MLTYKIRYAENADKELWDGYVRAHPEASVYHLFGWRDVIHTTYGHASYYLMLTVHDEAEDVSLRAAVGKCYAESIAGVLPLVHLKSAMFGNDVVSLPFFDSGGILANGEDAEQILLAEAIRLGQKVRAGRIELRQQHALASCHEKNTISREDSRAQLKLTTSSNKVRMLLSLPESAEILMQSFKSKLRSQITKPLREGLSCKSGGLELVDDFYKVFLVNMRHLGSPVHSVKLMQHVVREFTDCSRIFVVYKSGEPVASSLVVGFKHLLGNPWASAIRKYASLSPNMLLYLRMLEFACDNGYRVFDFGRSTPGQGTYNFKKQWGAIPKPLNWYDISLDGKPRTEANSGIEKFELARRCWRRLPLMVTKVLGPQIRKHISL